jgi:hypothetical protein
MRVVRLASLSWWFVATVLGAGCTAQWDDRCTGVAEVAGMNGQFAIRKTDGSFWWWGERGGAQVALRPRREPSVESGPFVSNTTCVAGAAGRVSCPIEVDASDHSFSIPRETRDLAVYRDTVCSISADSHLDCTGWRVDPADLGDGFSRVAVGADHLCAIRTSGATTCRATTSTAKLPDVWSQTFDEVTGAVQVVATQQSSCVRTAEGAVSCWGSYDSLGRWPRTTPKGVEGLAARGVSGSAAQVPA